MIFEDRIEAGRRLAVEVERWRPERPVVIGLPRGGVPVAAEVARVLGAPLDVLVVRKLGAPGMPEYGVGAIAEGGVVHVSREALASLGLVADDLVPVASREARELERRVQRYRGGRPVHDLHGRTVIVVDDGVATGGTARAAIRAARELGARKVILAAPVVAPGSVEELRSEADEVAFVEAPEGFVAVGAWYRSFPQTSDEEVTACLARARVERHQRAPDGEAHGEEGHVNIPLGRAGIAGCLGVPSGAWGVVVFAHGSGSSRKSPRNRWVASLLRRRGLATLLIDLQEGGRGGEGAWDLEAAAERIVAAVRWLRLRADTGHLRVGVMGSSTGAAAALLAAAMAPGEVAAVVSRGGRPDAAGPAVLSRVRAPVLLVVGGADPEVLRVNQDARERLLGAAALEVVPGAGHLFEEPGALDAAAGVAARWFEEHLRDACGTQRTA